MKDAEAAHSESRLPSWALPAKLILRHGGFAIAEEDEEQNKAAAKILARFLRRIYVGQRTGQRTVTHMAVKHNHCVPSWATPSRPAAHSNVSSSLQQPMALRDGATVRILAKPAVAEVVPSRTK